MVPGQKILCVFIWRLARDDQGGGKQKACIAEMHDRREGQRQFGKRLVLP
jgi:hypothetical protein